MARLHVAYNTIHNKPFKDVCGGIALWNTKSSSPLTRHDTPSCLPVYCGFASRRHLAYERLSRSGSNTKNGQHATYAPAGSRSKTAVLGAIMSGIRGAESKMAPLRSTLPPPCSRITSGPPNSRSPECTKLHGEWTRHAPRADPETARLPAKTLFCPSGANLMQNLSQNQRRVWESW